MRPSLLVLALLSLAPAAHAGDSPALITYWGRHGSGAGQLDHPRDVALAPNGNVYAVDQGNNRVQYFTSSGVYLGEWGGSGSAAGQFSAPPTARCIWPTPPTM